MYELKSIETDEQSALSPLVVPELTVDDIIADLKLDTWEARKIPNFREDQKEVGQSFMIRRFNKNPVENTQHHDVVLKKLVNEKYKTLQYDKGIRWLDPFLMEGLLKIHSYFYLEPGSKLCVTCDIGVDAEVLPGDTVRRFLILVLSHDGSTRLLGFCDTCPVCANTLAIAKAEALNKAEKNYTLDDSEPEKSLEKARQLIDLVKQRFYGEQLLKYGAYAELELEESQIDNIFRTIINAPLTKAPEKFSESLFKKYEELREAFETSPGQGLRGDRNGWAVLGAVSNYTKRVGKTELDQYIYERFGGGRSLRNRTMQILDEMLPETAIPVPVGMV